MKHIFIMAHSMDIGGAEKSLLGILENIDTTRYQVDLFLLRHEGELLRYIPAGINLMPADPKYSLMGIPLKEVIKRGHFRIAYKRYIGKKKADERLKSLNINTDNNIINEYSHKYTVDALPQISQKEYDLAISFMSPHYYVAKNVNAKKKVAWIHTDYSKIKVDVESETAMWDMYDKIIAVSEMVMKAFLKTFSSLNKKVCVIENIVPFDYIKKIAEDFTVENEMKTDGSIKILSIGRFSYPKRFDEVPLICKKIRENGLNVKWYLIGFGGDEQLINSKIAETNMEEFVINLGKKDNPYPYIKACDFYIQPSRYEGKSIAVREAQLFSKPVVITNYTTAQGQLKDGIDGIIVPMELTQAADAITDFIKNTKFQQEIISNTKNTDYIGKKEVEKIYALLE